MAHTYVQRTGHWYHNGSLLFTCYAGHGDGLNNPAKQTVVGVGPLPVGTYTIGAPIDSAHVGKYAMPLLPDASNEMHGRSAFFFHGDNPQGGKTASNGCIVKSPRVCREQVWDTGDHVLTVVAEETDVLHHQTQAV